MKSDKFKITKTAPGAVEIIQVHPDETYDPQSDQRTDIVVGLNRASIVGVARLLEGKEKGALQWL